MEPSNPENKNNQNQEHKTHTTALVLLVIASLIIAYVVLTYSGDMSGTPGEDDQTPATSTEATSTSEDATTAQSIVRPNPTESTADLPDGIYLEVENITDNNTYEGGQQIVKFTTDRSTTNLYSQYQSWMSQVGFEPHQEIPGEEGESSKIAATRDGEQLTVILRPGDEEQGAEIIIDYVQDQ